MASWACRRTSFPSAPVRTRRWALTETNPEVIVQTWKSWTSSDAVDRRERGADGAGVEVGGRAFHEDAKGIADEAGRAPEDEQADRGADDGVPDERAGHGDEQGRDEDAHAAEGVGGDMEERPADVEAVFAAPVEDGAGDDVGRQAEDGDGEHQAALDRLGGLEALIGLEADHGGDPPERDAVEEGGEDLEAAPAEGAAGRRGPGREPEREQAEAERGDVGEHVAGVGEEGQAAAREAAGELDDEDGRGDEEGDLQRPLVLRVRVAHRPGYIFSRAAMRSSMGGWVLKRRLTPELPPLRFLRGLTM